MPQQPPFVPKLLDPHGAPPSGLSGADDSFDWWFLLALHGYWGRIGRFARAVKILGHIWYDLCHKGVPVSRIVALLPCAGNWYQGRGAGDSRAPSRHEGGTALAVSITSRGPTPSDPLLGRAPTTAGLGRP